MATSDSDAGRSAAADAPLPGSAATVRPESALTPERFAVTCTGTPTVCGVNERSSGADSPGASDSATSPGETSPSVALTVTCAPVSATSPSLRACKCRTAGTPTST